MGIDITLGNYLDILYLLLAVLFFASIIFSVLFYRRYSTQVEAMCLLLTEKRLLRAQDYEFWQRLGYWGFGFLVAMISRIRNGKVVKLSDARILDAKESQCCIAEFELGWIRSYYKCVTIMAISFLVLLLWTLMR